MRRKGRSLSPQSDNMLLIAREEEEREGEESQSNVALQICSPPRRRRGSPSPARMPEALLEIYEEEE